MAAPARGMSCDGRSGNTAAGQMAHVSAGVLAFTHAGSSGFAAGQGVGADGGGKAAAQKQKERNHEDTSETCAGRTLFECHFPVPVPGIHTIHSMHEPCQRATPVRNRATRIV